MFVAHFSLSFTSPNFPLSAVLSNLEKCDKPFLFLADFYKEKVSHFQSLEITILFFMINNYFVFEEGVISFSPTTQKEGDAFWLYVRRHLSGSYVTSLILKKQLKRYS